MTIYNVHISREMRLTYADIEADTPQAAAAIAAEKPTDDADNIEDCDGDNLSALVDVAGDDDFSRSVDLDFEAERVRKAASALLTGLQGIIDYAENEAYSLDNHKDSPEAEAEAERAWKAVEAAQAAMAAAKAAGISSKPATAMPRTPPELSNGWELIRHEPQSDYGPDAYTLWPYGAILKGLPEAAASPIAATGDMATALTWLLDDLADAGEDRNPETGEVYDSIAFALAARAKAGKPVPTASHTDGQEA